MIKAEWTNADALDLQPTCNQLATDTISRQAAIDTVKRLMGDYELSRTVQTGLHILPSEQPEVDCQKCVFCGFAGFKQFQTAQSDVPDTNVGEIISILSDIRSKYNCLDAAERPYYHALSEAINALSEQPEIIRCKDCKNSEHWYRDRRRCFLWHEDGIDVFEDGYCNYAERRTDEAD